MTPILTPERPTVAHRPALAPHQQYVQWTEHHQHQAQELPPCAIHLWQYLLYKYPGGVPQEIDLEEVRFFISQGRSKTYCVQSLKNALWKYLVPKGLVEVVKQFTKRIMRVVANHAGPIKEIEKRFDKTESNLHSTKQICKKEPETIDFSDSIQSYSKHTQSLLTATEKAGAESECCDDEELEQIRAAIADAPFMQSSNEQESSPPVEPPVEDKFSAPVARTILERLRDMNIPLSQEVRALVAKIPVAQLERNVSALEEESATIGLKSPIAALKHFVANNCQPRNDRQAWWNRAEVALGKQRRSKLIQAVFEHAGEAVVMFTNGRRLPLAQVQRMSWEAIVVLGDGP